MGMVSVYTDASVRQPNGPAGAGAVLLDERGKVLVTVHKPLPPMDSTLAEWYAALAGVERAADLGARHITLFCDNAAVISTLKGQSKARTRYYSIYLRIMRLTHRFDSVRMYAIPRWENTRAHHAAAVAVNRQRRPVYD